MRRRLCFIIPYFGKMPNYFPLFLKSCSTNIDFNWLIFTDDATEYDYPPNVRKVSMTFLDCKRIIQSKFNCPIALYTPYKLCDLKPMYGYIFEEYLKEYRFWGHCDVDTIMGNLGKWLTDEFLDNFDKLFCLGHMTIYRNTPENNRVFMTNYKGREVYKEALATPDIYTFDESWKDNVNINTIFECCGKRCYKEDLSLNIACPHNKFHRIQYLGRDVCPTLNGYSIEDYKESVYLWNQGNVCRYYKKGNTLICEDFLYMHLQWRKMRMQSDVNKTCVFQVLNDEFRPFDYPCVSIDNFDYIPKCGLCWHTQRIYKNRIIKYMKKKFCR